MSVTVHDFRVLMYSLSWNPSHNMNTELQSKRMDIFCQWSKARTVCCGRKTIYCGKQSSILIHYYIRKRMILIGCSIRLIPLDIHHNIFPTVLLQMLSHKFSVPSYGIFCNSRSITIPAVPPHRCCFHLHLFYTLSISC